MFVVSKAPRALLRLRSPQIITTLIFFILVIQLTTWLISSDSESKILLKDAEIVSDGSTSAEELYLTRLSKAFGLSEEITWRAWRILPSEQPEEWLSLTQVGVKFDAVPPKSIDLGAANSMDLYAKKRMKLPVPTGPLQGQVDASDFLFGVSTTYARLKDRDYSVIKSWSRWLTNDHRQSNGASLVIMLNQAKSEEVDEVDRVLQAAGIDGWVTTTGKSVSMAKRYFDLARILTTFSATLSAKGQDKRWFGLLEDDVFFPSLSHLRDRLFSYNTDSMYYIGLPSEKEDWDTNDNVITTYGGGAVLLSRTAIAQIPNLPCLKTGASASSFTAKRWDELVHECILKNLDINMHVLPAFFSPNDTEKEVQMDSYEMGMRPLLLRRYSERHMLNINKAHLVSNVCGESCFMQRYLFKDDWVLVNGVSLAQYPKGIDIRHRPSGPQQPEPAPAVPTLADAPPQQPAADTTKRDIEHNFDDVAFEGEAQQDLDASVPQPTKLHDRIVVDEAEGFDRAALSSTGPRYLWRLMDSAMSKEKAVWQAYVKRADRSYPDADQRDSVIVLIWENSKSGA